MSHRARIKRERQARRGGAVPALELQKVNYRDLQAMAADVAGVNPVGKSREKLITIIEGGR